MPYRIVFFDIDGTLLAEGKIPPDTKSAVLRLKDSRIHAVIATGRSPCHLKPIAEELQIDSYIAFNGSYVVHRGERIIDKPLPVAGLERLNEFAAKFGHPLVYIGERGHYATHENHPDILHTFRLLTIDPPVYDPSGWKDNPIYQAMLYCGEPEESVYAGSFPDLKLVRWHRLTTDVIPFGGSKARGVAAILRRLDIPPQEAAAFGDGLNDREMLSLVGMGVAMGNAHPDLKACAKFTTKSVNDGGISFGLRQIGLGG